MNSDLTSQLYMLMSLSHLNTGSGLSGLGDNSYLRSLLPILIAFSPLIIKLFYSIYEIIEDWVYIDKDENIISIKFPVHEVKVNKDGYGKAGATRQLYSINYLAVNDFIRDNLDNIIVSPV